MPKVVSTVLISEAYCCRYLVAISLNSNVLISDTGSSSHASIDGYCLNGRVFNDAKIEAGSDFRALDISAECSFIVDNNAFALSKLLIESQRLVCTSSLVLFEVQYLLISRIKSFVLYFLLFRNSSTIKSLFEGSVIFRNDILFNIY